MVNVYKSATGDGEQFVSVSTISKELGEINEKSEAVSARVKSLTEELAKAKETLLVLTGAKLAFKKIVDASDEKQKPEGVPDTTLTDVAS